ncbi:MAG: ribosome assembly RNA-binding protein YhbY [Pseudomonadota bacterium]|nr:ribosome assembly RNA-binding protein YhbY [Pseudomonadota bacterium]
MAELSLTPRERRTLAARAHELKPVVLLGAAGLTDMVLREIDRALVAHQLVKVRVPDDDREQRTRIFTTVAEQLSAARVQSIGKTIVLFRPSPESEEKEERGGRSNARPDERLRSAKNRR